VVDLHAITAGGHDPRELALSTRSSAAIYLAAGLDPVGPMGGMGCGVWGVGRRICDAGCRVWNESMPRGYYSTCTLRTLMITHFRRVR